MKSAPSTAAPVAPLWRNRNYLSLFTAQIISLLGSGVTTVGLALFVHQYVAHFAWTRAFWLITCPAAGRGTAAIGAPLTFNLAGIA